MEFRQQVDVLKSVVEFEIEASNRKSTRDKLIVL